MYFYPYPPFMQLLLITAQNKNVLEVFHASPSFLFRGIWNGNGLEKFGLTMVENLVMGRGWATYRWTRLFWLIGPTKDGESGIVRKGTEVTCHVKSEEARFFFSFEISGMFVMVWSVFFFKS